MTEKLFQYIWQFGFFDQQNLKTEAEEEIRIIQRGTLNVNEGPDFLEAKIRMGNTIFAGSVELHIKTSDWHKHGHSQDTNYNNVVLHVVYKHDIKTNYGAPVIELQPHISYLLLEQYERLMNTQSFIPCVHSLSNVKEIVWIAWKERLVAERLTRKAQRIFAMLQVNNNNWEETFWWLLARNFGGTVNAEAFESIAKTLPVNILARHKNNIHQLEGLLLGQSGLLSEHLKDDYTKLLQREYEFLKTKYGLKPNSIPVNFLRMRPGNFPTVRLAQLAQLIYASSHLFAKVLATEDINFLRNSFRVVANDYWHYHYRIDEETTFKPKRLGEETINNILINTIVPMLFAYGLYHKNEDMKSKALLWLSQIKSEHNVITKGFMGLTVANISAYDSQALIELKNEYCNGKRCLQCAVGNSILKGN
jgi:hypothetical protein